MSIGLIALLDDVAALAKVAAASLDDVAAQALADGRGGITTRITALYVLGYLDLVFNDLYRHFFSP